MWVYARTHMHVCTQHDAMYSRVKETSLGRRWVDNRVLWNEATKDLYLIPRYQQSLLGPQERAKHDVTEGTL